MTLNGHYTHYALCLKTRTMMLLLIYIDTEPEVQHHISYSRCYNGLGIA